MKVVLSWFGCWFLRYTDCVVVWWKCGGILRAVRPAPATEGIYCWWTGQWFNPRLKMFVVPCLTYFVRVGKCVFFWAMCFSRVCQLSTVHRSSIIYNLYHVCFTRLCALVKIYIIYCFFVVSKWVLPDRVCSLFRIICKIGVFFFLNFILFHFCRIWGMAAVPESRVAL